MEAARKRTPEEWFWKHVDKNGPTPTHCPALGPCWEWTGGRSVSHRGHAGYGVLYVDGKPIRANRFALSLKHGPLLRDELALHHCDNPGCVNYETHLFKGSRSDNTRDMFAKSRDGVRAIWRDPEFRKRQAASMSIRQRGVGCHTAKLTEAKVIEIRSEVGTLRALAAKFGVDSRTIGSIRRRETWKHVP